MGQITIEKNVAGIEGLCVITPAVHGDNRGYFMETYSQRDMEEAGININFVQDNQSMSTKGVLRGLHFQKHFPQTKLVRAIKGAVFDVAVDLRTDSETYGKWYGILLTEGIRSSSLSLKDLHMDSSFLLIQQNSATSAMTSIILTTRVVSHGMTRQSVLNGQSLQVLTTAQLQVKATL